MLRKAGRFAPKGWLFYSEIRSKGQISAANAELAQVETAAQAAATAQTSGVLPTAFMLDEANVKANTDGFGNYITGQLTGAYWITVNGTVFFETKGVINSGGDKGATAAGKNDGTMVTAALQGDPQYPNLYYDEGTNQFVSSIASSSTNDWGSGAGLSPAP